MDKFDSSKIIDITLEELYKRISNEEILRHYIPGEGKKYDVLCHFHKENTPSMHVDLVRGRYKCFGCGVVGTGIQYVMDKYHVTFTEALTIIFNDFGLLTHNFNKVSLELIGLPQKPKPITNIKIKSRTFLQKDIYYWKQFNISIDICKAYNVKPITHYWIDDYQFEMKKDELAYSLLVNERFKIYKPYNKEYKWFSNLNNQDIFGYDQLDENKDLLIITKSLKDCMVFRSININAISPQSEQSFIPEDILNRLKKEYKKIIIWFDNDTSGIMGASRYSEKYDIPYYILQDKYSKDPAELVNNNGIDRLKEIIKRFN